MFALNFAQNKGEVLIFFYLFFFKKEVLKVRKRPGWERASCKVCAEGLALFSTSHGHAWQLPSHRKSPWSCFHWMLPCVLLSSPCLSTLASLYSSLSDHRTWPWAPLVKCWASSLSPPRTCHPRTKLKAVTFFIFCCITSLHRICAFFLLTYLDRWDFFLETTGVSCMTYVLNAQKPMIQLVK